MRHLTMNGIFNDTNKLVEFFKQLQFLIDSYLDGKSVGLFLLNTSIFNKK